MPEAHHPTARRALRRASLAAATAAAALAMVPALTGTAAAAAPAPCGGVAQISDATGDGHHVGTDVLSAWLSEAAGRLQAVIKVSSGIWAPEHDDANAAGYAFLFRLGGEIRYVRAEAPQSPPLRYDYGTWTPAGGFASQGTTAGALVFGGGGTVTLDVPAATGATPGAVLRELFVLTYDGEDGPTSLHWVDRAPGGTAPVGTDFGADYVVGACGAGGGLPGGPPGTPGTVTAITLTAPSRHTGGGRVKVRGSVTPARAGVPVELTVTARRRSQRQLVTAADGSFSTTVALGQTTRLRAVAGGLGSETRTIKVFSRTTIKVRHLRGGGVLIRGRVSPALAGRVLLLRTTAVSESGRTKARKGRFSFRFSHLPPGRYQAVFVPSKGRAERSVSNKGVVK